MVKAPVDEKGQEAVPETEELNEKIKELEDNWKRTLADYRNLQKRIEKEKAEFVKYANERILQAILPVRDALVEANKRIDDENGLEYVVKQLDDILKSEGLEKIKVEEGDEFDPNIMQVIDTEQTKKEEQENKVAAVYRAGFKYRERLIRPVEVRVYA